MRYLFCLLAFCTSLLVRAQSPGANPPAAGFNTEGSDARAIDIADAVMEAQGGRQAWDNTHYLVWTFFGRRTLTWDKWSGWVRIDWADKSKNIVVNINSGEGKVWLNGIAQTHADSLSKYLDMGKRVWINDSYWLAMPFKLKDSGVTLKYLGDTSATQDGRKAYLLQMTFQNVGVTPDNKYHVWVDQETKLVTQWAYFKKYTEPKPDFINPWTDYAVYGRVRLSGGRGRGALTNIAAPESVPEGTFE